MKATFAKLLTAPGFRYANVAFTIFAAYLLLSFYISASYSQGANFRKSIFFVQCLPSQWEDHTKGASQPRLTRDFDLDENFVWNFDLDAQEQGINDKYNELGISEHDMMVDVTMALNIKHWKEQGIRIFTYLDDEAGYEKTSVQSIRAASKRST